MARPRPLVAGNWKMNGLKASMAEFEAMLAGVPVVATNAGAAPDILDGGKAGMLFDTQLMRVSAAWTGGSAPPA